MLIGFGAMAQAVIERLPAGVVIGWIVARESHHAAIHAQFGDDVVALASPMDCAQTPDLVLECASQQAVAQYGEAILGRGWHLAVISTGALADSALEQRLEHVAACSLRDFHIARPQLRAHLRRRHVMHFQCLGSNDWFAGVLYRRIKHCLEEGLKFADLKRTAFVLVTQEEEFLDLCVGRHLQVEVAGNLHYQYMRLVGVDAC
jgi:hypothetical protein